MSAILDVQNIRKHFGTTRAVDDVSFQVRPGEIKGLLGPNGAGKTTAIRMIMGIIPPDQGRITFAMNGGTNSIPKEKIGYLPEERGLYYDAKVIDNLLYLAKLKGKNSADTRKRALEWLERLDLGAWANSRLDKLSKGMQQKVQFVASILHEPEFVMLDEPFSGLDPINQNFFKDLIQELKQQGTTVLLSAHQMNLVEELCDSLTMIHRGRLVLEGDLDSIKDGFPGLLLSVRYEDHPDLDGLLSGVPGLELEAERGSRMQFRYRGHDNAGAVAEQMAGAGTLLELSVEKPPLHDIFIATVKQQGGQINEAELA